MRNETEGRAHVELEERKRYNELMSSVLEKFLIYEYKSIMSEKKREGYRKRFINEKNVNILNENSNRK